MPLVNSALLSSKEGETVRLVGKIRSVVSAFNSTGSTLQIHAHSSLPPLPSPHSTPPFLQTSQVQLILIASDQGSVEVNLSNDSPLSYAREGQFIEVVGKVVQGGDGIKEYTSMFLSDTVGKYQGWCITQRRGERGGGRSSVIESS